MVVTIERPAASAADRFEVLDALRGICALLVALYHFDSNGLIASLPFVQNGWLFVDYFFVLSGFVIAHSYGARLSTGEVSVSRFMGLRLGRIYPLHIAVLLAFVALEMILILAGDSLSAYVSREPFSGSRDWGSLLQSVFVLQSFGIPGGQGWNIPAWSIAAELWTYLLFALIFLAGRRAMLAMTLGLVGFACGWLVMNAPDLHVTFNGGVIRCVFGFGIGALTYHAFCRFGGVGGTVWEVAALIVSVAFVSVATHAQTFAAPLFFAAMIFILASQKGAVSRILSARAFQFLGLISYSIYMVHMFVQGRIAEALQVAGLAEISVDGAGRTSLSGSAWVSDLVTLSMLAIVIAASYLTYRLIEQPGRSLSRKWLSA